jgi:hypothetical protein
VHPQFFVNHLGCFAAQDIPMQRDLDIAQEELSIPAPKVEIDKRLLWEEL